MDDLLKKAYVAGVERVAAWSDLLDAINVFPVADGDTGRNLAISLSPLRFAGDEKEKVVRRLLMSARGNSGNIASQFFSAFYAAESVFALATAAQEGNKKAWQALGDPRPGTMLTVFDALEDALWRENFLPTPEAAEKLIARLAQAVSDTQELLPKLKEAGVIDAGALGMYIFFEGFFLTLAGATGNYRPVTDVFKGRLQILSSFTSEAEAGYCVDFVLRAGDKTSGDLASVMASQESAIVIGQGYR
ncbi:MAG: DAK2 domain-containing protein [Smithellaceae bacterium]